MSVGTNTGNGAAIKGTVPNKGLGIKGKAPKKVNQRLFAFAALVAIYILFCLLGKNFFSFETALNILDASNYIGFMAIGVTFVIISGGIDLSLGTVALCSAMVGGVAWRVWGLPFWVGLILVLVTGVAFGLFNGLLVARLKLPSFIATLGTMMIAMGLSSIVSKVQTITYPARTELPWFKNIFQKWQVPNGTSTIDIPTGAVILLIVLLIAHVILTKTKIGRYTFAIGSNEEAARLSGVNVVFWKTVPYVISSFCAALGGIAYGCTYTTIIPGYGQGLELDAIAACFIGGASTTGGIGSVFGTIIGVFIMSCLKLGLPSMNLQPHYQKLLTGIVVIIAVLIDISQQKKKR